MIWVAKSITLLRSACGSSTSMARPNPSRRARRRERFERQGEGDPSLGIGWQGLSDEGVDIVSKVIGKLLHQLRGYSGGYHVPDAAVFEFGAPPFLKGSQVKARRAFESFVQDCSLGHP
jgi:hypothetical protein